MENGAGTTNGGVGGGGGGEGSLRNSVSVPILTPSGDCVTLTKAAATAESSVSDVRLYPEKHSCHDM